MSVPIFHLAFPVKDVESTVSFYRDKLGLSIDLIEEKRCIINLFGHQLVAHLSVEDTSERPQMYPRHFGIIVAFEEELDRLMKTCQSSGISFYGKPMHRFEGSPREHRTFFIADPSNNVLEFKWYKNSDYILRGSEQAPTLEDFLKNRLDKPEPGA